MSKMLDITSHVSKCYITEDRFARHLQIEIAVSYTYLHTFLQTINILDSLILFPRFEMVLLILGKYKIGLKNNCDKSYLPSLSHG